MLTSTLSNVFQPPTGQTCQQWAGPFLSAGSGYLQTPDATADCQFCQFSVGDQFFLPLGYSFSYRWRDLGIFIGQYFLLLVRCVTLTSHLLPGYTAFNFIISVIGARFLTMRYAKR